MSTSDQQLQQYYAARAPEYDRIYQKPERQADLRQIEAWLPDRCHGASVLEIACGTGYWTRFVAATAARVLAIDAAGETLQIARARVKQGSVEFRLGDAYAPPRIEPGFDVAFAGFWISHVPAARVRPFLLSLHQALKPGATVLMLDNLFVAGSSSPISRHDSDGNAYQQRLLADGSSHEVLKNFPNEAALREVTTGLCSDFHYQRWDHYWAIEYTVAAADR